MTKACLYELFREIYLIYKQFINIINSKTNHQEYEEKTTQYKFLNEKEENYMNHEISGYIESVQQQNFEKFKQLEMLIKKAENHAVSHRHHESFKILESILIEIEF